MVWGVLKSVGFSSSANDTSLLHRCKPRLSLSSSHLPTHPTAVDDQRVAADVAARPARQVDRRALEVVRAAPSSRGDAGADARQALGVVQQRRVHVRLDVSGGDGVDRDALGRPFICEALGDLAHCALGRRVRRDREAALEGEQRGKVDYAAAAAGGGRRFEMQHVCAYVSAEREYGIEVDLHDLRRAVSTATLRLTSGGK